MTTAAPSVPISAQAIASPPTPVSARSQSPNYLQRLVQNLDPKVAAHHKFCERAFRIAQLISIVMVPVLFLAVGSVLALGLSPFSPLLLIGSSAITGLSIIGISDCFKKCAQKRANKACHLTAVAERLRSLPQDPRDLATKLASMHITWNRIPGVQQLDDLTRLKPLIALYDETIECQRLWEHVATHWEHIAPIVTPYWERMEREHIDSFAAAQNSALTKKIKAAFVHAIIQNPEFSGKFKDLALISTSSASADRSLLLFDNLTIRSITRAELSDDTTMPIHRLAERFVQAMTA